MIQSRTIQVQKGDGNKADLKVYNHECEMIDCQIGKTYFSMEIDQAKVFIENLQWAINEAEKYKECL